MLPDSFESFETGFTPDCSEFGALSGDIFYLGLDEEIDRKATPEQLADDEAYHQAFEIYSESVDRTISDSQRDQQLSRLSNQRWFQTQQ